MQNIISLFLCIKKDLEVYAVRYCVVNSEYRSSSLLPSCYISVLSSFSIMNMPHLGNRKIIKVISKLN